MPAEGSVFDGFTSIIAQDADTHPSYLPESVVSESVNRTFRGGIILTDIVPCAMVQYNLFQTPESSASQKLMHIIDNVNFGMGTDMLKFATAGTKKNWKMRTN